MEYAIDGKFIDNDEMLTVLDHSRRISEKMPELFKVTESTPEIVHYLLMARVRDFWTAPARYIPFWKDGDQAESDNEYTIRIRNWYNNKLKRLG